MSAEHDRLGFFTCAFVGDGVAEIASATGGSGVLASTIGVGFAEFFALSLTLDCEGGVWDCFGDSRLRATTRGGVVREGVALALVVREDFFGGELTLRSSDARAVASCD